MVKILVGILILLPCGVSMFLPLSVLPKDLTESRKQAAAARIENNPAAELNALATVVSYAAWQGENWQRLGRLRLDQGDFVGAVEAFQHTQVLGDLTVEGRIWLADALNQNGEKEEARELLRGFTLLDDVDPFTFLQAALIQRSLNDTNGALVNLLKAYKVDPLNGEINYQIGLLLTSIQPDESLPFLEQAGELIPAYFSACVSLSTVIRESVALGESGERYVAIGQELATMNEWDVAQRAFEKATDLSPNDGEAWALTAEAAQQNGEDGEAFILKARELEPDIELVNGLSGLYYRRQGKPELAMIFLQKALDANPDAVVWEIEMGNTLDGMGNLADALKHFQNATMIDPHHWSPWRALAVFCVSRNYQLEEVGLTAARRALSLYDTSPALMDLLGTALMLNGDLDEALYYFLEADAADPNETAILIHLGQLYLAKGENQKALEYLQLAKEHARDNRLREMAIRLLKENGASE